MVEDRDRQPACETKTDEDKKLRAVGIAPFIWLHHPVNIALDDADEKREQRGWSRSEIISSLSIDQSGPS